MNKVVIIFITVIISAIIIFILVKFYNQNKKLKTKVKTLTKSLDVSSFNQPPIPTLGTGLVFRAKSEYMPSEKDILEQMKEWKLAGVVYSVDPVDNTILNLERRLEMPGRYIGNQTRDESTYNYRVVDKHGFVIELPRSYSQLLDDSIIDVIPGMETKGQFKVNLYDNSYINILI